MSAKKRSANSLPLNTSSWAAAAEVVVVVVVVVKVVLVIRERTSVRHETLGSVFIKLRLRAKLIAVHVDRHIHT